MFAGDLIADYISPLKTSDTGYTAMLQMEEYKVSHLPIVNNTTLLGLISEQDINASNTPNEPVGNHALSHQRPYVLQNQHLFDAIRMIASRKLTLLPVLDEKENYLGCITLSAIVDYFAKVTSIDNPGAIIVLELNINDYSLSEISQIVESNGAKILCLYIQTDNDSMKMDVTLKLNKMDVYGVLQTFNRYNYIVKASITGNEYNDYLKDRLDSFMNYLSI